MRIVATSDTHFTTWPDIPNEDVLIVAGDILLAGTSDEWFPTIETIAALPHKHKVLIGGNHDKYLEKHTEKALVHLRQNDIHYVGHPVSPLHTLPNGMTMLGLPFVTDLPRWAFNKSELFIRHYLEDLPAVDIVVSHSPPYGILDGEYIDAATGRASWNHFGVQAYNQYAERAKPKLWICGHVHEGYGSMKRVRPDYTTKYVNVAMCDLKYKQVNPAVVIDV